MKTYIISCIAIFLLCNCAAFKIKPRLAKGMPSFRGQFPFFAFLDIEHEDGGSEICGASLISDRWILTSARCLEDAQEIIVHLGYLNLEEEQEDDRLQFIVHPRNWLKNPNYLPDGMVNDIGLIKLPEAVVFNNFVQPIELSSAISPNVEVIAIGNGATKEGELGTSETIESIDLSITTMSECSETFPFLRHGGSSFCAKDISGERKSIRQGDLGGPLIRKDNGKLIGIGAFMHSDGSDSGRPQGFTNVGYFHSWIQQETGIDLLNQSNRSTYRRVYRPWARS